MKTLTTLICLLVLITSPVLALEEAYEFDDPSKQTLFIELTQELRCPQCQNQNIADSDAMIAHDLRRKVYELINQGKSRDEIVAFMKSRYGDFVSYKPPVTPLTIWLWLLPVIFVIAAAIFVFNQRKKQSNEFDEDVLAQADSLLEKEK
ncbi:cytochrome c-type biogenesis protein [Aliiglaciecola lipolytica]|uniref:Cytochrome c-type biogenesis protein n=1 Tax=Aliiglaciecola lipolytica E3 TaxID=1127673 RepID=K6YGI7_9ALTE|nr:cytochrome c-type biogenesis protein [Aliiglaciecola lipolytica]GAC15743.1 cytochrome c-type biogenesis protein CcmH [Aliiglaciecola lipolytica E3]